jgi:hypothetical protein
MHSEKENRAMATRRTPGEMSLRHEPAKEPYAPPLLTRYGTVEELTPIVADVANGSGIPTDFSTN